MRFLPRTKSNNFHFSLIFTMGILSVLSSQKYAVTLAFQSLQHPLFRWTTTTGNPPRLGGKALGVSISNWTAKGMPSDYKDKDDDDDDEKVHSNSRNQILDPLIVCGPSGVGKGTIIERFMSDEFGGSQYFGFTTSHTTRAPRRGEIDKVHYNFVSEDHMKKLIEEGKFLETAKVHGNYYGTSWDSLRDVQRQGKRCLLDIDVQGVKRVKSLEQVNNGLSRTPTSTMSNFQPKYIFIAPVNFQSLEARLQGRGTESAESLVKRTKNAKEEVEYGLEEGNFDYVLVNDDLDMACQEFYDVVKKMYDLP